MIANPDWSSRPNGDDMARFYSERAQHLEMSSAAIIRRQVTAKRSLTGCSVLSEEPGDLRLRRCGAELSRLVKMKPKLLDGQAVEGATVKIPIAFRIAR